MVTVSPARYWSLSKETSSRSTTGAGGPPAVTLMEMMEISEWLEGSW